MNWPKQNAAAMNAFYGPVGENQTRLVLPYKMHLTWNTAAEVNAITCHAKVADSLGRILTKTLEHYGARIPALGLDRFSGCLNVRKMRGGTAWSIHSWGAAVDLDDERNQLRWSSSRAQFAKQEYIAFWNIVESEGWVSLGRAKNYDWMHFQAATL